MLSEEDFYEKTEKIRKMPRHKKYTIFNQRDEKLQKIHEKEFPVVFFAYDDIKEKGNRLYKRGKFREAIQHYCYAYGLLRWIEFKDKKRGQEIIAKPSLDPILDDDIEEKIVYMDDVKVEEDSYQACVVYLLKNLGYTYMELRHFTEAIDCFDEALEVAGDRVPDLFFRRSQARTYNKYSKDDDYELAMKDIEKAISLKPDDIIFKEHLDILKKIVEKNLEEKYLKIESINFIIILL
jgi:tetratricopeptide (TPR) repeat protein